MSEGDDLQGSVSMSKNLITFDNSNRKHYEEPELFVENFYNKVYPIFPLVWQWGHSTGWGF